MQRNNKCNEITNADVNCKIAYKVLAIHKTRKTFKTLKTQYGNR